MTALPNDYTHTNKHEPSLILVGQLDPKLEKALEEWHEKENDRLGVKELSSEELTDDPADLEDVVLEKEIPYVGVIPEVTKVVEEEE